MRPDALAAVGTLFIATFLAGDPAARAERSRPTTSRARTRAATSPACRSPRTAPTSASAAARAATTTGTAAATTALRRHAVPPPRLRPGVRLDARHPVPLARLRRAALLGSPYRLRAQLIFARNINSNYFGLGDAGLAPLRLPGLAASYDSYADYTRRSSRSPGRQHLGQVRPVRPHPADASSPASSACSSGDRRARARRRRRHLRRHRRLHRRAGRRGRRRPAATPRPRWRTTRLRARLRRRPAGRLRRRPRQHPPPRRLVRHPRLRARSEQRRVRRRSRSTSARSRSAPSTTTSACWSRRAASSARFRAWPTWCWPARVLGPGADRRRRRSSR